MTSIILTLMSIGLAAAVMLAAVNYIPGWKPSSDEAYLLAKDGLKSLDKAFQAGSKANGGVPPAPILVDIDGGLNTLFSAYYGFLPKAPTGYNWKYGHNGLEYYICMYPSTTGATSKGYGLGFKRLTNIFSDERYFVNTIGCGSNINADLSGLTYPASVYITYYVKYVPF